MAILYRVHHGLYVNLTNRCSCACTFCVRGLSDSVGEAESLWLSHEPTYEEVIAAFDRFDMSRFSEVVFCGFGEPTEAWDTLTRVARYVKETFGRRGEVPRHLREARRALPYPCLGGVARFESAPKTHIAHTSRPTLKPSSRPIPKALTPLALTPPWPPPTSQPYPYASTHHRTTGGLPSVASNTCRSRKRLVT